MKRFLTAIMILSATFVLGNASVSSAGANYWKDWTIAGKGSIPACGTDVLGLGGDDILKSLADTYCKMNLGEYVTYVNPTAMTAYKSRSTKYPEGQTAAMVFEKAGLVMTVDHKSGRVIFGAIDLAGKSKLVKDQGHPLNEATCKGCHVEFNDACVSGMCGNRIRAGAK